MESEMLAPKLYCPAHDVAAAVRCAWRAGVGTAELHHDHHQGHDPYEGKAKAQ
jgi:hypothetical protein